MKRIFLGSLVAAAIFSGPALAADIAVKAPLASVAPAFDWAGFYAGGHVGYGWGQSVWTNPGIQLSDHSVNGFLGGGQAGFNYQVQRIVLGVEVDGSRADISGHGPDPFGDDMRVRTDWLATVTGRVGIAAERWLVYGKGGAAWAGDRFSFLSPAGRSAETQQTRSGWTAGAGIEYAAWSNWSLKLEYAYMDFGNRHVTWVTGDFADIDQKIQTIKLGLNYRFGGPVVARY